MLTVVKVRLSIGLALIVCNDAVSESQFSQQVLLSAPEAPLRTRR